MNKTDWYIEGIEFGNCNCAYGCPCQFEALPTHGDCRGFEVLRIDKGHFGDVKLDGLNIAMLYAWPVNLFWILGLAVYVLGEKMLPSGQRVGRIAGAGMVLWEFGLMAALG